MSGVETGCRHDAECQDIGHMAQERGCGKDAFEAVGGNMRGTRVESWASRGRRGRKIDGDDIDHEFQGRLLEECPTGRWGRWR